MKRHYVLELKCPRCGDVKSVSTDNVNPPPRYNCGSCLLEDVEVIELAIVNATVVPGSNTCDKQEHLADWYHACAPSLDQLKAYAKRLGLNTDPEFTIDWFHDIQRSNEL
jgi:ribosomal protein S27AE